MWSSNKDAAQDDRGYPHGCASRKNTAFAEIYREPESGLNPFVVFLLVAAFIFAAALGYCLHHAQNMRLELIESASLPDYSGVWLVGLVA
jgi:hypothetical protein